MAAKVLELVLWFRKNKPRPPLHLLSSPVSSITQQFEAISHLASL